MSWVVVVPVKGASGKSRLDHSERAQLAEAFALDTVTALVGASVVSRVFVVTADERLAGRLAALGAEIVAETPPEPDADPLNAAIGRGVGAARARFPDCDVAVVTGDLPALASTDVAAALSAAAGHERSMIADEEGTGTTAILALAGVPFTPRFGVGSRAAHEAAGHVPLDIPPTAPIRRDVDTAQNLAEAVALGVGPHTRRLLAASAAAPATPATPSAASAEL
jgi:2-phospho-L-lactate/phosphoenolpyruvate guanylyltransferase